MLVLMMARETESEVTMSRGARVLVESMAMLWC